MTSRSQKKGTMRYFRCKCGKREVWSSMGMPECSGCPECHTTLEETPSMHQEPSPHRWEDEWRIVDQKTGESGLFVRCSRCNVSGLKSVMVPDDRIRFTVDGAEQRLARDKATGPAWKVKAAASVDPSYGFADADWKRIEDDDEITVVDGSAFRTIPPAHL